MEAGKVMVISCSSLPSSVQWNLQIHLRGNVTFLPPRKKNLGQEKVGYAFEPSIGKWRRSSHCLVLSPKFLDWTVRQIDPCSEAQ